MSERDIDKPSKIRNLIGLDGMLIIDEEREITGYFAKGYLDDEGVFYTCDLAHAPDGRMLISNSKRTDLSVENPPKPTFSSIGSPGLYLISGDTVRQVKRKEITMIVEKPELVIYTKKRDK